MKHWACLALVLAACKKDGGDRKQPADPRTPVDAAKRAVPTSCPDGMSLIPAGPDTEPFCLDRTEVTREAYFACVDAGKCRPPSQDESYGCMPQPRDRHPVDCVTIAHAQGYCAATGGRLPSAEEWQWAAGGGDERRAFPWGDSPLAPTRLNGCGSECTLWEGTPGTTRKHTFEGDDGFAASAPVGSFPAGRGRWELDDLAGNVSELTSSVSEVGMVDTRGGNFHDPFPEAFGVNSPSWIADNEQLTTIGFRCAH